MAFIYGQTTNATVVGHGTRKEYEVRLGYQLNSQDKINAKSNITLRLEARSIDSDYRTYGYNQTSKIDGVSLNAKSFDMRDTNEWQVFGSRTFDVKHDEHGKYSSTKSGSFTTTATPDWSLKSGSASVLVDLPDILRASSVSCSSPYIGKDNVIITVGKKVTEFTSTVTYEIGTIKGTLAEKSSETVFQIETLPIKEEIYALIPNDKKISGTVTCTTYSGDTQIGEPTTAIFNLYAVEEDCKPIVSGAVVDTNEETIVLTGDSSIIVKNASKPKVTVTAEPKLSSTIKSYSINLNDGQTSALQEDTFDTINSSKITVSATDSRGYSNSYDIDLAERIVDYVKLHFNLVELSRPEGTSNEVILDCDGVWFNGNFKEDTPNTLKISFQYRLSGETEWIDGGEITPTIDGNKFSFNNYSLGNLFDYNSEYQFKIIATDLLMTAGDTNKEAISVPKGQEVWFECEDGIGVYGHIWLNDQDLSASDTLPIGAIVDYDGDTVPDGYEEVADYSTDEIETGEKWIDGKPIYRKVFEFQIISLPHRINVENVDTPIKMYGIISYNAGWHNIGGNTDSNYYSLLQYDVQDKRLSLFGASNYENNNYNTYIIFEYTKTTD